MRTRWLAALLLVTGCAGGGDREPVVVLAAASLAAALGEAERAYEAAHPEVDLRLSHAGSQVLAAQVREGAPADLLVTADEASLRSVAGLLGTPRAVARNQLALVVAAGDPADVTGLADLGRPGLRVVLAAPSVPAGALAREALQGARVMVRPVSLEPDVQAVVARVRQGEADAGLAYVTDLRAGERRGDLAGSPVPGALTTYPAAVVRSAGSAGAAAAFLGWLAGHEGQAVLRSHHFLPPA